MIKRVVVISEPNVGDDGPDRLIITGCQRSGTTLLGMILEAHPRIDLIDENNPHYHPVGEITYELDVEAAAKPHRGNSVLGFKAPRDSHRVAEIVQGIPHLRVLWIERDILQVVSSMLSLKVKNGVWAMEFAPREIRKHIAATADEIAQQLFVSAGELAEESDREVFLAALCWLVKRDQRREAQRAYAPIILHLTYDDLVLDPESSIRRILEFLNLDWHDAVLSHHSEIDSSPEFPRPGGAVSARPVDADSLSKQKSMGDRDRFIVSAVVRAYETGSDPDW